MRSTPPTRAEEEALRIGLETVEFVRNGSFNRSSTQTMGRQVRRLLSLLSTHNVSFGSPDGTWAVVREMVRQTLLSLAGSIRIHDMTGRRPGYGVVFAEKEGYPLTVGMVLFDTEDHSYDDLSLTNVDAAAARMIGRYAPAFVDVIPERVRAEALPPSARPTLTSAPHIEVNVSTEELRQEIHDIGEQMSQRVESGLTAGFERLTDNLPLIIRGIASQAAPAPPQPVYAPAPEAVASVPETTAPPAAPTYTEQAVRNAWSALPTDARISVLIRVVGTDPLQAKRIGDRGWNGLDREWRRELFGRFLDWVPKTPPPSTSGRQRQVFLGEGAAPVGETARFQNLAERLEPRTLSQIFVDGVIANQAARDYLVGAIAKWDVPSFIVLYGEIGGTGKTSMARAFARDYLAKAQEELTRRGYVGEPLVTATGRPVVGVASAYLQMTGERLADPQARIDIRRFLNRAVTGRDIFAYKKILLLDDADKIPASTIAQLKDLLQADIAGETTTTRNNVVIATTNNMSLLVDTPLGTRGVQLPVKPLSPSAVSEYLHLVTASEQLECDPGVIDGVARRSSGSLRSSLKELGKEVLAGHCRLRAT